MAIHINEVLPVLERICKQQVAISDRLQKLTAIFKRAPEPVEPVLRSMLAPIRDRMTDMEETLGSSPKPPI
jgi:hypothetical protein